MFNMFVDTYASRTQRYLKNKSFTFIKHYVRMNPQLVQSENLNFLRNLDINQEFIKLP